MNLTALPPAYLPTMAFFWNIAQTDQVIITDHFQYVKRSSAAVSAPIGQQKLQLRIPVLHDENRLSISKKRIQSSRYWRNRHYKSLKHIFNKTPFAEYYLPDIQELLNMGDNLAEFNIKWLEYLIERLHLPAKLQAASKIGFADSNEESIKQWCTKLSCSQYITDDHYYKEGWINSKLLKSQSIDTEQFTRIPNVNILQTYKDESILELLFQFGPEAGYIIRQYLPSKNH